MARIQVHNRCFHIPLALFGGLGVEKLDFKGYPYCLDLIKDLREQYFSMQFFSSLL